MTVAFIIPWNSRAFAPLFLRASYFNKKTRIVILAPVPVNDRSFLVRPSLSQFIFFLFFFLYLSKGPLLRKPTPGPKPELPAKPDLIRGAAGAKAGGSQRPHHQQQPRNHASVQER